MNGMQLLDQPPIKPEVAVAVSVTDEFTVKFPVHPVPEPQLMGGGLLTTVPVPVPTEYTVSDGRLGEPPFGSTPKLDVATTSVPFPNIVLAVMFVTQGGVVEKQFTAVASPDELIVATSTSADCQVTELVKS